MNKNVSVVLGDESKKVVKFNVVGKMMDGRDAEKINLVKAAGNAVEFRFALCHQIRLRDEGLLTVTVEGHEPGRYHQGLVSYETTGKHLAKENNSYSVYNPDYFPPVYRREKQACLVIIKSNGQKATEWCEEQVFALSEMLMAGIKIKDIAEVMGRTKLSVYHKIYHEYEGAMGKKMSGKGAVAYFRTHALYDARKNPELMWTKEYFKVQEYLDGLAIQLRKVM